MKCKRAEYLIAALIGRDISEDDEKSLREHLAACPQCRNAYEIQMAIEAELKDVSSPVASDGFAQRTAQLAKQCTLPAPRFRPREIISWIGVEGVAGVTLALMIGFVWVVMGGGFIDWIRNGLLSIRHLDITLTSGSAVVVVLSITVLVGMTYGIYRAVREI